MEKEITKETAKSTLDLNQCTDDVESVFDIVNMYGTYNIQKTADTSNEFPMICQGLPKASKNLKNKDCKGKRS